jgi:hypothetical protein
MKASATLKRNQLNTTHVGNEPTLERKRLAAAEEFPVGPIFCA